MTRIKNILYLDIICMALLGCVDPFEVPSSKSNTNLLVVEGRIGDEETFIRLSRTTNLDGFGIGPEGFAFVQIEDELGSVIGQLNEIESGTYFLEVDLVINEKYRVRIETTDREVYHSDYATLISTPPISALGVKIDSLAGSIDIELSTEDPANDTRYYLWDYEETYEYNSRYKSLLERDGGNLVRRRDENQIFVCWETDYSSDILLQTSIQLEKDIIANKPIVSYKLNETDKFDRVYSLLVNQYALSSDEYDFWSLLEKNSESPGTLFDPQPSQLSSNIQCTSDPEKGVVGYIGASSKAQRRVFVNSKDLPRNPAQVVSFCEERAVPLWQVDAVARVVSNQNNVPLAIGPLGELEALFYTTRFCGDCREQGGTNVRPSFWFE
ncbi:MAG: DUF4249 domain-containing protein [Ekhidna sp.]